MEIYKLQYPNKETAIADLIAKGVYTEIENLDKELVLSYSNGTQAVVEIGQIAITNGTYDENGVELTAPIFASGYHYDVMTSEEIVFENEIQVNNPKHSFAGYNTIKDEPTSI